MSNRIAFDNSIYKYKKINKNKECRKIKRAPIQEAHKHEMTDTIIRMKKVRKKFVINNCAHSCFIRIINTTINEKRPSIMTVPIKNVLNRVLIFHLRQEFINPLI